MYFDLLVHDLYNPDRGLEMARLYYYLGQWRGLHQKYIQEKRYAKKFRNNNRPKMTRYHRDYYRKRVSKK